MNDFTASNGVRIWAAPGMPGALAIDDGDGAPLAENVDRRNVDALREFFGAEADERLNRWRDPAQPEFLVYPVPGEGSRVHVIDETTGVHYGASRESARGGHGSAAHYFDAHPEPKPWDAAQEGDIWALTGSGGLEQPWRRHEGKWISCTPSLRTYDAAHAIAGRCIWSEVSNGD